MQTNNPIIQTQAHHSRNPETYRVIRTQDMLDTFARHGWTPHEEKISKVMTDDRAGFQRHLVRLQHPDYRMITGLSDANAAIPELCVMNSHDGTTALRIFAGVLRMACLNGMIAGTAIADFRVIHSRNSMLKLEEGIERMVGNIPIMLDQMRMLQSTKFTPDMEKALVKATYDARLERVPNVLHIDYRAKPRRYEDFETDGYTVMNRVQEKIIRGGINYVKEVRVFDDNGTLKDTFMQHAITRRLNSIQQNVRLNRMVYDKAIEIARAA